MLRNKSDFVRAAIMSHDLQSVAHNYLTLHRKYVNGLNGVYIPDEQFALTFGLPKSESFCEVVLHFTDRVVHNETLYYDSDSDYFSESWGADNSYGTTSHTSYHPSSKGISIPVEHLMMDKGKMEEHFKERQAKKAKEELEAARLRRVKELEEELSKLKS
jgi:hypothetical protein